MVYGFDRKNALRYRGTDRQYGDRLQSENEFLVILWHFRMMVVRSKRHLELSILRKARWRGCLIDFMGACR